MDRFFSFFCMLTVKNVSLTMKKKWALISNLKLLFVIGFSGFLFDCFHEFSLFNSKILFLGMVIDCFLLSFECFYG